MQPIGYTMANSALLCYCQLICHVDGVGPDRARAF